MKKIVNMIVRGLLLILVIVAISLLIFLVKKMDSLQLKVGELNANLLYLQDSTAVVLSNLGQMEENIEASLEEEGSLIEDYRFSLKSCDLALGTYEVDMTLLPKEYTESTQVTVYFGTKSYNLELQGLAFKGTATLSLQNDYDGNVTVLFTNGEKRATEILHNYVGFPTMVERSLQAHLANPVISVSEEQLLIEGLVDYELDGQNVFSYESLHLFVQADDELIYDYDLVLDAGGDLATDIENPLDLQNQTDEELQYADEAVQEDDAMPSTEEANVEESIVEQTNIEDSTEKIVEDTEDEENDQKESKDYISGISGNHELGLSRNLGQAENVKIYLCAITKEGYQFYYYLYDGNPSEESESFYVDELDMSDNNNVSWKIK